MKVKCVLDTHAVIWSAMGKYDRLGTKARHVIECAGPGELAIPPPPSLNRRLIEADKIDLGSRRPAEVFEYSLTYNAVIPTSLDAALKAPVLPLPHTDPYDRLIVAEALVLGVPVLTKDGNIADSGVVRVLW